jgi:hypothetical protein
MYRYHCLTADGNINNGMKIAEFVLRPTCVPAPIFSSNMYLPTTRGPAIVYA